MAVDNIAVSTATAIGTIYLFLFYKKSYVSKMLAGFLVMLAGIGIMYYEVTHAWAGFMVFATGFITIIASVFARDSKNRIIK